MSDIREVQPVASKGDNELIRRVFSDGDKLLLTMRAAFFGFELTTEEKELLRNTFSNDQLRQLVRKRFLPTLAKDAPIGQISDTWLGAEQMIFGQPQDTVFQALHYKEDAIKMAEIGLASLENPDGPKVQLDYAPSSYPADNLGIVLLARNMYIRLVEQQLLSLKFVASTKEETPEAAAKRAGKDSSE